MSFSVRVYDVITLCRCEVQACQFKSGFILHSLYLSNMTQFRFFYLTDGLDTVSRDIYRHNRKPNVGFDFIRQYLLKVETLCEQKYEQKCLLFAYNKRWISLQWNAYKTITERFDAVWLNIQDEQTWGKARILLSSLWAEWNLVLIFLWLERWKMNVEVCVQEWTWISGWKEHAVTR